MATIVCWRNPATGYTTVDDTPPEDCVHIHGVSVDGPDGEGDTTVVIDWTRVDGQRRLSWATAPGMTTDG